MLYDIKLIICVVYKCIIFKTEFTYIYHINILFLYLKIKLIVTLKSGNFF